MSDLFPGIDGTWLDGLEFCSRVYALHEALMRRPDAVTRLRLRPTDFEKRMLEELLPLCRFIQTAYGPGRHISARWSSGSQPHDAEYLQRGRFVEATALPRSGYIEITGAMHRNEHLVRERLESHGHAFAVGGLSVTGSKRLGNREVQSIPVVYGNNETIAAMAALILRSIEKKVGRYPEHTSLIVECTLNSVYSPTEWEALVDATSKALPSHGFDGIFLCSVSTGFTASIGRP